MVRVNYEFTFTNERLSMLDGMTSSAPPNNRSNSHAASEGRPQRSSSRRPHKRPRSFDEPEPDAPETDAGEKSADSRRTKKFRFKKKHRSSRHDRTETYEARAYYTPLDDEPGAYDDTHIPNAASWKYAPDQDAAFRESLFDAMADDEGAAFWEGVYGQPIHTYDRPNVATEKGHLEQMTDEEYAQYVRTKMWEKSHEHIEEERRRRQEESDRKREQRKEQKKQEKAEWEARERERKRQHRSWRERRGKETLEKRWTEYLAYWKALSEGSIQGNGQIPWPVASGRMEDISRRGIEEFLLAAPTDERVSLLDTLKNERIRWHPDKAQQRWGKLGLGERELRMITAVFQVLDTLWAERRNAEA